MAAISEEAIRERAYLIWEREGRPHGCDYEHWVRAQVELLAELAPGNGGRAAPRARGAGAKAASLPTNSRSAAARAGAKSAAKPSRPGARAGRKPKKSS